jgi:hypothetical protein
VEFSLRKRIDALRELTLKALRSCVVRLPDDRSRPVPVADHRLRRVIARMIPTPSVVVAIGMVSKGARPRGYRRCWNGAARAHLEHSRPLWTHIGLLDVPIWRRKSQ